MPLTLETLRHMEDDHAVAALRAEFDPLTSTPLEVFLLDRLETLLDAQRGSEGVRAVVEEYDLKDDEVVALIGSHPTDLKNMAALLATLTAEDIVELSDLQILIEFRSTFRTLANDGGSVFARLNTFINQAQE